MKNQSENTEADFSDFKNDNEQLSMIVSYMFTKLSKKNKRNLRSALSKTFKEKCDALESQDPSIKDAVQYFIDAVAEEHLHFDPKKNWYHMLTDPTNIGKIGYILATLINENLVASSVSKIGTEIHKRLSPMLLNMVGMKTDSYSVAISMSGGSEANLLGIKLALKNVAMKLFGDNVSMYNLEKIPVMLVSDNVHYSFYSIADTLRVKFIQIKTNKSGLVEKEDLKLALENITDNEFVFAIISVFGATRTGYYDELPGIAEVIEEYKKNNEVWWHIDAAYGGPFLALDQFTEYKKAIAYADSLTIDAHKHLWTPFGAGFLCVKNALTFRNISTDAIYIDTCTKDKSDQEYFDGFFDHIGAVTITGSRLSAGVLSTYLTLVALGEDKIKKALEQTMVTTKLLAEKLVNSGSKIPIVITSDQKLNLLTFKPKTGSLTADNILVEKITKYLSENTENGVLVSEADLNNADKDNIIYANRICIMSPLANESDVDEFVATYKHAIEVVAK